jgi:uncharacterized Ntn-hydrolase superfamily protein
VAAQAIAEPAYGPRWVDAVQPGASAQAALAQAQAVDEAALLRQVGVVAADGSVGYDGRVVHRSCGPPAR